MYSSKKLGRVVKECLERGGTVTVSYPMYDNKRNVTTSKQALEFIDKARTAFNVEDKALIVEDYKGVANLEDVYCYQTFSEDRNLRNIQIYSSFIKEMEK